MIYTQYFRQPALQPGQFRKTLFLNFHSLLQIYIYLSQQTILCIYNSSALPCLTCRPQTPAPEDAPALVKKIGKTTYKVRVHFSQTSTETMSDKIKRMLKNEIQQM